jgi:arabinan endo-1,5-alpha-L-arabinosidase
MFNSRRQTLKCALGAAASGVLAAPLHCLAEGARSNTLNDHLSGDLSPVHDPCIIQDDSGNFHLFSTSHMGDGTGLIHWRTSADLVTWKLSGAVMQAFPAWVIEALPKTRGAWAPDIAYFNDRYNLYYAASIFGINDSVIGLMTTPTLDTSDPAFGWKDEGMVWRSSSKENDYNAIDPNHVIDADGRHWLSFGSFWTGLKLIELDPATGKPKYPKAEPKSIARRRSPSAIEAPFITRRGEYYYLFASYDFCCRGVDSTYYTCVGRSKTIDGPYTDRGNLKLTNEGGTIVLHANLDPAKRFKGPGGASILQLNDRYIIVYHAYDADKKGAPTLRMQLLAWTSDGWPVAV